jgi:hypothetical protein
MFSRGRRVLFLLTVAPLWGAGFQPAVIDEGELTVRRGTERLATERFKVTRAAGDGGPQFEITVDRVEGTTRTTTRVRGDSLGRPSTYEVQVLDGATEVLRLNGTSQGNRLLFQSRNRAGDVSTREVLMGPGVVVTDDEALATAFLVVRGGPRTASLVAPRTGERTTIQVRFEGDPLAESIDIGGKATPAKHLSFGEGAARRDVWLDAGGRLLRVQAGPLVATRSQPPK